MLWKVNLWYVQKVTKPLPGLFLWLNKSYRSWCSMWKKSIQLARTLSLDVVLGSIIGSLFIADYLQVRLPPVFVLALAICVWLIYTADHLSDALNIPHAAHMIRHRFHQKYFKPIAIAFCVISVSGLVLLSQLPFPIILWGSVVLCLVGLYFVSIRWLRLQYVIPKEFVIALLYSIGIFLAPVYLHAFPVRTTIWILFVEYLLIALCNLLLFSWYEKELDEQDNQASYATVMGGKASYRTMSAGLWFLYGIVGFAIVFHHSSTEFLFTQLIILFMTLTLHCIMHFSSYLKGHERYRLVADAIFLYPVLYLLW